MTYRYGAHTCPSCGKLRYLTKDEAKKTARRMKGRRGRLNAYRCGNFWHLGHLPAAVVSGDCPRDDIHNAATRAAATNGDNQ